MVVTNITFYPTSAAQLKRTFLDTLFPSLCLPNNSIIITESLGFFNPIFSKDILVPFGRFVAQQSDACACKHWRCIARKCWATLHPQLLRKGIKWHRTPHLPAYDLFLAHCSHTFANWPMACPWKHHTTTFLKKGLYMGHCMCMFSKASHGAYIEALKRDLKLLLQTVMPHFRVRHYCSFSQLSWYNLISFFPLPSELWDTGLKKAVATVIRRCDWNICWHTQCGVKLSWSVSNSSTAAALDKNILRIIDSLLSLHWSLSCHTKPPSFIFVSLSSSKLQIKCPILTQTEASKSVFSPQAIKFLLIFLQ